MAVTPDDRDPMVSLSPRVCSSDGLGKGGHIDIDRDL